MLKKKASSGEKKRKHASAEGKHESRKRKSAESNAEQDIKDDLADPELDRISSDIEEGGLDLTVKFQPITAYVSDKREMLQQCFHVLGEKKLRKMLPDELKDYTLEEIKKMCWEQLEEISESHLLQVLAGEEVIFSEEPSEEAIESQQDNNVDSTSCLKDATKAEDTKEAGGSSEESDVLSINADAYDSDIEAPKDEQNLKTTDDLIRVIPTEDPVIKPDPIPEPPTAIQVNEPKKDIQSDIDKSVSEILSFAAAEPVEPSVNQQQAEGSSTVQSGAAPGTVRKPSIQQLELLELEMRARAIKALMKASKKITA